MKLEFQGKSLTYNLDGSLKGTIVTLGHMDGGHLPVVLAGDKTALSNQELFELALVTNILLGTALIKKGIFTMKFTKNHASSGGGIG